VTYLQLPQQGDLVMSVGTFIKALLVAGPLAMFSSASQAAPITYDFTGGNAEGASLSYLVGGLGLTVTGFLYSPVETINAGVLVNQSNNGLGVCGTQLVTSTRNCGADPMLDGGSAAGNDNELLKFSFSSGVSLQSISFFNNDTNDVFDFFLGEPLDLQFSFLTPSQGQRIYSFANPNPFGSVFAIGLRGDSDQVRIAGLTVFHDAAVVPLPGAGLLLIGAFGTLAVLRRRRGEFRDTAA
jgi:hypothetical protein